jgi:hypothetical protein
LTYGVPSVKQMDSSDIRRNEIPKIFGSAVSAAMRGAGREYHELLLHVLKDVGHELKKTAKDIVDDDRDENR